MAKDEAPPPETLPGEGGETESQQAGPPPQYWLRVHGYPSDLSTEVVYYNDFYDLTAGRLPGDPRRNLKMGDVLVYFADGPASLYGVAVVTGEVEGPFPDPRRGERWVVPIKREAIIRAISKAPHAVALEPPSGLHFLWKVRDATYIKLPDQDGPYLVAQVKSRASTRD
jgi:hypothetical protein